MKASKTLNLNLFGLPAAGKGTQALLLEKNLNLVPLAPGALIKEEMKSGSELGKKIQAHYDAGTLIPLEDLSKLVWRALKKISPEQGIIFDGLTRNEQNMILFNEILKKTGRTVKNIEIAISDAASIERQQKRLVCTQCGAIYAEGMLAGEKCTKCGGVLGRRSDATPEAIAARMEGFRTETLPVLEQFRAAGNLIVVNGEQSPEAVYSDIIKALGYGHS